MTNNRLNIGIFTCHIDNDYAIEVCKGAEFAAICNNEKVYKAIFIIYNLWECLNGSELPYDEGGAWH